MPLVCCTLQMSAEIFMIFIWLPLSLISSSTSCRSQSAVRCLARGKQSVEPGLERMAGWQGSWARTTVLPPASRMQGGTGTPASLSCREKVVQAPSSTYRNLPSGSDLHALHQMSCRHTGKQGLAA